jgi:hypothetical protein
MPMVSALSPPYGDRGVRAPLMLHGFGDEYMSAHLVKAAAAIGAIALGRARRRLLRGIVIGCTVSATKCA